MTSERIDQLDAAAEVFYRRLMSKVDDHGLYDARLSILRSSLFPLRVDRVREADIARWIAACEKAGVIALYVNAGKPYLQMMDTRWVARSEPKYPLPPENSCKQLQTPVYLFGVGVGDVVVVGEEPEKTVSAPFGAEMLFEEFWKTYPKKVGKDAAKKAFSKRKPNRELLTQMLDSIREQVKTDAWCKDGGQFIPHPATWLNEGRWMDEGIVMRPVGLIAGAI